MKRTPIVIPGQVYLHTCNEYIVVTRANKGEITFRGPGIAGVNEVEVFLNRFGPVNPEDLSGPEHSGLVNLLKTPVALTVGWVKRDDDEFEEDDE